MSRTIPPEYFTHQLTHRHAGNGFYFLEALPEPGYVRVATFIKIDKKQTGVSVFTAHQDMLSKFSVTMEDKETHVKETKDFPIPVELQTELKTLREDLSSGKKRIHHWGVWPSLNLEK